MKGLFRVVTVTNMASVRPLVYYMGVLMYLCVCVQMKM
jgi:hypothetical protein